MFNKTLKEILKGEGRKLLKILIIGQLIVSFPSIIFSIRNYKYINFTDGNIANIMNVDMFNIFVLIISLIMLIVSFFLSPGLIGATEDILNGKSISIKSYFEKGKKYFWGFIGYSIKYYLIIALPITIIGLISTTIISEYSANTANVVSNCFKTLAYNIAPFTVPLITLELLKYQNNFLYYKKHFLYFLYIFLAVAVLNLVPILGGPIASFLQLFMPLMVLCWFKEWKDHILLKAKTFKNYK